MPLGSEAAQPPGSSGMNKYHESENGVMPEKPQRPIAGEAELVSKFEHTDYSAKSGLTPEQRLAAMSTDVNKIVSLRADAAKKQQQEDDADFWVREKEAAAATSRRGSKADLHEKSADSVISMEKDVKGAGAEKDTAIRPAKTSSSSSSSSSGLKDSVQSDSQLKDIGSKAKDDDRQQSESVDAKSVAKPKDKLESSSEQPRDNLTDNLKVESGKSKFRPSNADVLDDDHPSERVSRMDRDFTPKRDGLQEHSSSGSKPQREKSAEEKEATKDDNSSKSQMLKQKNADKDVAEDAKAEANSYAFQSRLAFEHKVNASLKDSFDLDEPVSLVNIGAQREYERMQGERASLDRTLEARRPEIGLAAMDEDNHRPSEHTTLREHFHEIGTRLRHDLHLDGSSSDSAAASTPSRDLQPSKANLTAQTDQPWSVPAGKNPSFVPSLGPTPSDQRTTHGDKPGHAERVARVAAKHPQLQKDYKRMGGADPDTALPLASREVAAQSGVAQDHAHAAQSDGRIAKIKARVEGGLEKIEGDVESGLSSLETKLEHFKDAVGAKLHDTKERAESEKERVAIKLDRGLDKAELKYDQTKQRVSARLEGGKAEVHRDATLIKDKVSEGWSETKGLVVGGLDKIETKLESLEHSIEAGLNSAKHAVVDLKDDGLELVHKAGDTIGEKLDHAKAVVSSGVDKTKREAADLSAKASAEAAELKRDAKKDLAAVRSKFSNQLGDEMDPLPELQAQERDEANSVRPRDSTSGNGLFSRIASWWSPSAPARDLPRARPGEAGLRDADLVVVNRSIHPRRQGEWDARNAANYSLEDPERMQFKLDELKGAVAQEHSKHTLAGSIKEKLGGAWNSVKQAEHQWAEHAERASSSDLDSAPSSPRGLSIDPQLSASSVPHPSSFSPSLSDVSYSRSPAGRSPGAGIGNLHLSGGSSSPRQQDLLPLARDEVDYRSTTPGLDSSNWGSARRSPSITVRNSPVGFDEINFNSAVEPW